MERLEARLLCLVADNSSGLRIQIIIATVCTGIVGYGLKILIEKIFMRGTAHAEVEDLFSNLPLIAGALAAVGVLIIYAGLREKKTPRHSEIQPQHSFWIGIVQGICLPFRGFSRSGSTISTGLLLGLPKQKLEEFSFALAVVLTPPVIAKGSASPLKAHALERPRFRAASFYAGPRRHGFQLRRRIARVEMAFALARRRTLEIFRLLLPDRGGGRAAGSLQIPELKRKSAPDKNHFAFGSGMKIFFPTIKLFGSNPGFAAKIWSVVTLTPCARYALAMAETVSPAAIV